MMKRAIAFVGAIVLGSCASYSPRDLAAMETGDLCYMEYMQRANLSAEGRQAIQSELQRRNDNCRNHSEYVARQFADFMHYETYGKQHP